jgi:glycosidase
VAVRVIYQVYVPSFQDGNGDGVGDLLGLLDRLDYFTWLGIDACGCHRCVRHRAAMAAMT